MLYSELLIIEKGIKSYAIKADKTLQVFNISDLYM